jgi:DNA processing protein
MTSYGVSVTEALVSDLVASGFTIVSGLARGMDSLAHKTALSAGGLTVGVLGCGVDKMYPPENRGLADKIISGSGFVVSEFPCGMDAVPGNFPARNRIISGVAMGVLITEAAEVSGSLITASCAAEQGKPVFVVPGPITSSTSKGTNELIKKGAVPVTGLDDILNEFGFKLRPSSIKDVVGDNPLEEKILSVLRSQEVTLDELSKMLGMKVEVFSSALTIAELSGKVKSYGGKWSIKGQK